MTLDNPFKTIGVDYLGPLNVKDINSNDCYNKAWICLFTCATTRALHLEMVCDNSAETFILALRRFMSRRVVSSKVYSDNTGNFISDETQVFIASVTKFATISLSHKASVTKFATINDINWTFNPPAAPWWRGFYERLVQLTKRCLRKIVCNYIRRTEHCCNRS